MALLEVDSIDVAYGNVQVLWDVSLSVERGETVALLGRSEERRVGKECRL